MSEAEHGAEPGREEMMSALFAQLVLQQSNMAMMFLGKLPQPGTGEAVKDLEAARLFIDQLEMLEAKTKGNLTREEASVLKQNLMGLRLAFVQAVESPTGAKPSQAEGSPPAGRTEGSPEPSPSAPEAEEEHRKKFSKKY